MIPFLFISHCFLPLNWKKAEQHQHSHLFRKWNRTAVCRRGKIIMENYFILRTYFKVHVLHFLELLLSYKKAISDMSSFPLSTQFTMCTTKRTMLTRVQSTNICNDLKALCFMPCHIHNSIRSFHHLYFYKLASPKLTLVY